MLNPGRLQGAWRKLVLIGALVFLSACSTRLVYNYLDWIIPWYLDDYVELDREQDAFFEKELDQLLKWHRRSELPRYIEQLTMVRKLLAQPAISSYQLAQLTDMARDDWQRIVVRAEPALASLLKTFDDRQTRQFVGALSQSDDKRLARYRELDERALRERSRTQLLESLQDWLGEPTDRQLALAHAWSRQRPFTTPLWLDYRNTWRQGLADALVKRRSQQFNPLLSDLLLEQGHYAHHPYQQAQQQSLVAALDLVVDLHASLTPAQRQKLDARMEKLLRDLRALTLASG